MVLFAVSAFAGAGTIHYQTPMLAAFASEFAADPAAAGWVATLSFGGFLLGTILFVPLGDRFDKRRLILAELSVLIVALLAMAAARSLPLLAGAAFAVGVSASFPQLMIPLAAELARPSRAAVCSGRYSRACFWASCSRGSRAGSRLRTSAGAGST